MLPGRYQQNQAGVWTRDDYAPFDYSDGDEVEERLLKQLQEADDVSMASDELQQLMFDWPSEYHFSPLRANLLSSFRLEQFENILEIGSGCGAITRHLGESCPHSQIFALEGSARRAHITRERCRDLKNVEVLIDSFADFPEDSRFDLILLIGVLEYSPSFFNSSEPVQEALAKAHRLLSPAGVLVVAIENQLGLKYFNACAEDHTGELFYGINDRYQDGAVETFGRKQIQYKLEQAGYENIEFVFPFPDYKVPQLLLREEALLQEELAVGSLIGQYQSRDYSQSSIRVFQEAKAWNVIARNGLVQDFANSFLIFAFKNKKDIEKLSDSWLARTFSGRRKKRYLVQNDFHLDQGEILVTKTNCYPDAQNEVAEKTQTIIHHVDTSQYYSGTPYTYKLYQIEHDEHFFKNYLKYLTPWIEWLKNQAITTNQSESMQLPLKLDGTLYDCLHTNFIIAENSQLQIIDQEWEFSESLEVGFIVFRGLYREFVSNLGFFEQSGLLDDCSFYDVMARIFDAFSIPFNERDYHRFIDQEIGVQIELVPYNQEKSKLSEGLREFFEQKRNLKIKTNTLLTAGHVHYYEYLIQREIELDTRVWDQDLQIQQFERDIKELDRQLNNNIESLQSSQEEIRDLTKRILQRNETLRQVYSSTSWRATAPLRFSGYLLKGDINNVKKSIRSLKDIAARGARSIADKLLGYVNKYAHTESKSNRLAVESIVEYRTSQTETTPSVDPLTAPYPETWPPVDISAVTYNSEKWIDGFVDSLRSLQYPPNLLTIHFVDNASTDSTVEKINSGIQKLHDAGFNALIHHSKNNGYGAGHNVAFKSGSSPYFLVTNVDLVFDEDALQNVVATAVADVADFAAWELRQRPYEHPKFYDPVTGLTNWNSHACVLFKRLTLEAVGGYDETLFMYGEDVELSYRLRRAGALLRYCPRAVVEHFSYDHAGEIKPMQYKGSTFANLYLRLKYGTLDDILAIPFMAAQLLLVPAPFPGAKKVTLGNLFRLLFITPKALFSRKSASVSAYFSFRSWDYEIAREGDFVEQPPLSDDKPLVSVITRTYQGREQFLRQAMLSVAHQSYANIEHIIVQDGGDALESVVSEIASLTNSKATFVSIEKRGRSVAGNKGLQTSNGRFCLFLDDDDLLFGDHVELLVASLLKNPEAVAAYSFAWEVPTDFSQSAAGGRYREEHYQVPPLLQKEYDYQTLKYHNLMAIQSIMFERDLFEERGGFDDDLEVLEDWVLWLCYGYENNIIRVPKVTSLFRTPLNQKTRDARQEIIDAGYQPAVKRAQERIKKFTKRDPSD